jgi:hypothetical protein
MRGARGMQRLDIVSIGGTLEGNAMDYVYLSITSYTTLGVGDIYQKGALRIVTSADTLNGFVLITWSAAFTFPAMERFWELHRSTARSA